MSDVLIVGAGIAGCHAARELSREHDVTVLDKSGVAAEATGLSAGVVAPTLFYRDEPEIARHLNEFFRLFDGTHGFEFTQRNRLDFALPDSASSFRDDAANLAAEDFPVTYLEAGEVERRYPRFHMDDFAGAVEYRDTGWVDPFSYATALAREAENRGATIETDVTVERVVVEQQTEASDTTRPHTATESNVTGVETTDGVYEADIVVLAAGWRTRELLPPDVPLAIRPYRTQVVVLDAEANLSDEFPIVRIGSEHLYLRPEHNGDLLVGGAHALVDDPEKASSNADESFKQNVANYIPRLIEGFEAAGFVNGWAGIDAATPDTRPIVDGVGPGGLFVATGFNGLGIMASPVVGPTLRERLGGEPAPFPTEVFSADRFESHSSKFEYVSTSEI